MGIAYVDVALSVYKIACRCCMIHTYTGSHGGSRSYSRPWILDFVHVILHISRSRKTTSSKCRCYKQCDKSTPDLRNHRQSDTRCLRSTRSCSSSRIGAQSHPLPDTYHYTVGVAVWRTSASITTTPIFTEGLLGPSLSARNTLYNG
jgi:hypothetical protein